MKYNNICTFNTISLSMNQVNAISFTAKMIAGRGSGNGSGGLKCFIDVNRERISLKADAAVSISHDLVYRTPLIFTDIE